MPWDLNTSAFPAGSYPSFTYFPPYSSSGFAYCWLTSRRSERQWPEVPYYLGRSTISIFWLREAHLGRDSLVRMRNDLGLYHTMTKLFQATTFSIGRMNTVLSSDSAYGENISYVTLFFTSICCSLMSAGVYFRARTHQGKELDQHTTITRWNSSI